MLSDPISQYLSEELKIPIVVKSIFTDHNAFDFATRVIFLVEMTQEIVDMYDKAHPNELISLLNELFPE